MARTARREQKFELGRKSRNNSTKGSSLEKRRLSNKEKEGTETQSTVMYT